MTKTDDDTHADDVYSIYHQAAASKLKKSLGLPDPGLYYIIFCRGCPSLDCII